MWVIVFNAVDDFGIKEHNENLRMNPMQALPTNPTMEGVKQKLLDEALHGALRIAGLVRQARYCWLFGPEKQTLTWCAYRLAFSLRMATWYVGSDFARAFSVPTKRRC